MLAVLAVGLVGVMCLAFAWLVSRAAAPAANAEMFAYRAQPAGSLPELWRAPAFSFRDQQGKPRTQQDLLGHVWIADFIFTTCTSVCPLLSAKLVLLQHQLPDPGLRFVSFSVDPEHDTPEVLARYAERWRSDPRWILLSTDADGIQATARDMRVALMKTGDAQNPIMHTNMFFLVDTAGSVRGVYDSADDAAILRLIGDFHVLSAGADAVAPAAFSGTPAGLYRDLGCGACHEDPKVAPTLGGLAGSTIELEGGARVNADADYVRQALLSPGSQIRQGYLNLMPSYAGRLSEPQIEQLISYVQALPPPPAPPAPAPPAPAVSAPAVSAPVASRVGNGAKPSSARASSPGATPAGSTPLPGLGVPSLVDAKTDQKTPPPSTSQDPVCKMRVRVTPDTPRAEHAGHEYYFCSASCRDKFAAQPASYIP
jgi:protein SCO1